MARQKSFTKRFVAIGSTESHVRGLNYPSSTRNMTGAQPIYIIICETQWKNQYPKQRWVGVVGEMASAPERVPLTKSRRRRGEIKLGKNKVDTVNLLR